VNTGCRALVVFPLVGRGWARKVRFPRAEADPIYAISITPSWLTSLAVTDKRADGFTVHFGTPPNGNATLDWVIVR